MEEGEVVVSCQNLVNRIVVMFLVVAVYALQGCSEEMENPSQNLTDEGGTIFAGRVVDTQGNPVAELSLFMQYIQSDNESLRPKFDSFLKTETDENGYFSIIDIKPGRLQVVLVPYYELHRYDGTKYTLLSIEIGEVVYYPDESSPYVPSYRASFSITEGAQVEDIRITVKARMRIRGQIVFKDGTPLIDWPINLKTRYKGFKGGSFEYSRPIRTDTNGFFTRYVSAPGLYRVTASFQELSATSEEFTLNDGEHREDLVLTFDSEPVPWSAKWW